MRIGIFGDTTGRAVDDVIAQVRAAHDDGFPSFWAPQIFGLDALTTLAVAGREVPSIELGTARRADVPASRDDPGAAGADGAGDHRQPAACSASGCRTRSSSRECGGCRSTSPCVTCASTWRS